MALKTPTKTFDLQTGESTSLYFNAWPKYDAVKVTFDGDNSTSTGVDVTYTVDTNDEIDEFDTDGEAYQVDSSTGIDVSSGATDGTEAVARTVEVTITEGGTGTASGSVTVHHGDDIAQSAQAFLNE
jgi:hypothetical protein